MNKVFPKKGSLVKRASLVRIFSVSLSFLGIMVLFSFLYIKNYYNSPLDGSSLHIDEKNIPIQEFISSEIDVSQQIISSDYDSEEVVVKGEDLDDIEMLILETEDLLTELEFLI
ncbi:MAG: hypothetical protein PHR61_05190 [Candidatus Absconditabacteria bacterium]|nr:hypothetical protein [Candidatus Absconditabacteria bacterium]